jgi:hypothetical protein
MVSSILVAPLSTYASEVGAPRAVVGNAQWLYQTDDTGKEYLVYVSVF